MAQILTDDEVAAYHEAAHAVIAVFGPWTRLAGPVTLKGKGCGDVVMATDGAAIARAQAINPLFDRDRPRIDLIGALLAGPITERILLERGRLALTEYDLSCAERGDYDNVEKQLNAIDPPLPGLLGTLERDTRAELEQPETWAAVERFAEILHARGRLEAGEATAILEDLRAGSRGTEAPRADPWVPRLALLIALALAAFAIWRSVMR